MDRIKWKGFFENSSFEDPNYYLFVLLTSSVGIFIMLNVMVFWQERESLSIRKAVLQLSKEEEAFDQRTSKEGTPPFLSWERRSHL